MTKTKNWSNFAATPIRNLFNDRYFMLYVNA